MATLHTPARSALIPIKPGAGAHDRLDEARRRFERVALTRSREEFTGLNVSLEDAARNALDALHLKGDLPALLGQAKVFLSSPLGRGVMAVELKRLIDETERALFGELQLPEAP